jgi:hypothetical protein
MYLLTDWRELPLETPISYHRFRNESVACYLISPLNSIMNTSRFVERFTHLTAALTLPIADRVLSAAVTWFKWNLANNSTTITSLKSLYESFEGCHELEMFNITRTRAQEDPDYFVKTFISYLAQSLQAAPTTLNKHELSYRILELSTLFQVQVVEKITRLGSQTQTLYNHLQLYLSNSTTPLAAKSMTELLQHSLNEQLDEKITDSDQSVFRKSRYYRPPPDVLYVSVQRYVTMLLCVCVYVTM